MPVRKIPKNHLIVTGGFSSLKNSEMRGFESILEKEYMLLLEFDESVDSFEEQPLTIPLPGIARGYTPDIIVRFRKNTVTGDQPRSKLVEVKSTEDLKRNAAKYSKKFELAAKFAAEHGWDFEIITEKEIRTPRLSNLKFLREYRNICPPTEQCRRITKLVGSSNVQISVEDLLNQLGHEETDRLNVLPTVWHMVVAGKLHVDLDAPLHNGTALYANEEC